MDGGQRRAPVKEETLRVRARRGSIKEALETESLGWRGPLSVP